MPTKFTKEQKEAFRQRLVKGMTAHGYDAPGGIKQFAKRYAKGKSPMVSQWRIARYMPGPETVRHIAKDWECVYDWLYFGDGMPPKWWDDDKVMIFTPERVSDDDVTAAHIAIESLTAAILQRTQGAATIFLADMVAMCRAKNFSSDHALLGRLSNIAETVQSDEAKAAQPKLRGGLGRRTKS